MNNSSLLLSDFDDEMARTRLVLQAVRAEDMTHQFSPELRSIGWNANHLAEIVGWTGSILEESEFDIAPVDGPRYETPSISDPKELVRKFDGAVLAAGTALATVDESVFDENWQMKMAGELLFTMKKGACIRKWVINHTIHHRAILSVYLRMRGVESPPVYDS